MKKLNSMLAFTLVLALVLPAFAQSMQYPQTRKIDHTDTYHGSVVPDPYRWLEDDNSKDTAAWVEAQNKVTFGYLESLPYRAKLKQSRVSSGPSGKRVTSEPTDVRRTRPE